jgi:hypothetical protein
MNVEQVKLIHDHTKHLSTLSTGSLVLMITFYEKLGNPTQWRFLLAIALIGFVLTILAATTAQVGTIDFADPEHKKRDVATGISFMVSWLSFCIAIVALCVFGVKNIQW